MELIISAENIPKFRGMMPNLIAILYLDSNFLEVKQLKMERSASYVGGGEQSRVSEPGMSMSRSMALPPPKWVEKLRTELILK